MAAGLSVGLSGLAAGFAVGVVGDAGVRGSAQQPRLFVGMIMIVLDPYFNPILYFSYYRNDFNFNFCRSFGMSFVFLFTLIFLFFFFQGLYGFIGKFS